MDQKQQAAEGAQQKFIGNLLWDAFDLITFGAFEKRGAQKKKEQEDKDRQERERRQAEIEKLQREKREAEEKAK